MPTWSWRSACLLAGAPVGALAALALRPQLSPLGLLLFAALGCAALCGAAAWARGPLRSALLGLAGGAAGCAALAFALALAAGSGATFAPGRAEAVYDADARVATRLLPVCGRSEPRLEVLLVRGARPRLSPSGDALWLDAADAAGARQISRLRLGDGALTCWTCGEPADNRRPVPAASGLLFETTRHADWRAPANTEVYWIDTRGDAPRNPSRRLTYAPGPDDHALFAPGAPVMVWSRRRAGYEVVSAPIQRAHGGMSLGDASVLARGGAGWLAAAAWSPDARALVLLRGLPFVSLEAFAVDFATGARRELSRDAAEGGVAFSADGGFALVAEADGARTRLRAGPTAGALEAIPFEPLAAWGAPTGVSLAPDGRSAVVGQRRSDGAERIARVQLGCE